MKSINAYVGFAVAVAAGIFGLGAQGGTQLYPASGTASYDGASDFNSESFAVSGVDADAGGYARYTYSANATADSRLQGFKCYDASGAELDGNWDLVYKGVQKDYDRVFFLNPGTAKVNIRWQSSVTASNIKVETATEAEALAYADSVWAEVNDGNVMATVLEDYPLLADPFALLPKTKAALVDGTEQAFKIHMLGDSITQDSYYSLIQALLKRQFPKSNLKFTLTTSGSKGCWYYSENGLFDSAVKAYAPDLLIICGLDNFRSATDQRYVAGLEDIIDKTKAQLPNCEILYMTPAHSSDSRAAFTSADALWNAANLKWGEACASFKYVYNSASPDWWAKDCYKPSLRDPVLSAKGVPCWDVFLHCYDFQARSGRPLWWFNRDNLHNNERGKSMIAHVMLEYFKTAAGGEDPVVPTPKTLADVGATAIADDPNVELIDRKDGTYALVFKSAKMTKNWGEADYSTTFTFNTPWVVKEFLVVGGGGAGGGNVGAGGGGGGVIYFTDELLAANAATDNVTTNFENGSQISITIGAGGVGGFKRKGTSGGHSTLTLGAKTYTAFGGGGGGDYGDDGASTYISSTIKDDGNPVTGADGNTGCGAGVYNSMKGTNGYKTSMPSQPGYYGTNGGDNNGGNACGGGGGAGKAGSKSPVNNKGGDGGDGLSCSITGTEVYYAAGGGGGDTSTSTKDDRAKGGLGGGGNGSYNIGRLNPETSTKAPDEANATGFGCGGGGGNGGGGHTCVGGNGSAGIVVLLIEPVVIEAEKPVVSVLIPEQGANYAKFSVSVVADGLDNTTASAVWGGWAKEGDEIVCSQLGDGVAVNGSVAEAVTGLEVGATYAYKFYAVNGEGTEGDAVTGTITLAAGEVDSESAAPVITSGACTVIGTSVNLPYCVAWPGKGKETCAVTLKYGLLADKLSYSVALGSEVIGNGQAQAEGLIPGRKYYFQLTADNGTTQSSTEVLTATIADTETFPESFDARQPVIAGIGAYDDKFICGGDGVIYRGLFANYVAGTEVTFHYQKEGIWKESAAVVTPDGFTVTVDNDLTISTDYPFYFTATAGDFADCTQERTFNSKGPAVIADYIENGTQEKEDNGTRIYYLQGNNSDIGCGTNTVLSLLARKRVNNVVVGDWFVLSSRKLTAPIGAAFYKISDEDSQKLEFGASYDLRFRIENVSFGGQVFSSENKETLYKTTGVASDNSTYTWCGTDGLWNDPANWTTNVNKIGVAGYPVGYTATGIFTNKSAVTVRVERAEQANKLEVTNAKGLCLFGETAGASVTVRDQLKVTNSELVFAGTNPVLKAEKGITFADATKTGSIPTSFTFNIPADGYAEAPLQLKSRKFADEINASYKITLTVDPASGFLGRTDDGSQLLISSAAGIATNKIVFGEMDTECFNFRYAPAGSANPTELWLDVSVVDEPGTVRWTGAESDDWACSNNWKGGVAPIAGNRIRVAGTRTITLDGVTARVTDAWISIGEDGSLTLDSGTVIPLPTLDVSRPVAGKPLTVETPTFAGLAYDGYAFAWSRGATVATKDYAALSTEVSITPTAADLERFFKCTVTDANGAVLLEKEFFFSKLPVLYMTTDDGQTPTPQKEEHAGYVFVQGNAEWKSPYDGAMTIKVRGNSTSNFAKKPWKLKLDSKTKMFGIAKSKHWVLLANYKDKSSMRNKLAYDLANEIGSLGMESTWVECFLNGEYQGLYQFGEHIRIDKERVNIFDWEGAGEDAADAIAAANAFTSADKKALETQMSEDFAWVTSGKVTYTNVEYEVTDDFKNLDISGGYLVESSKEYDEVTKFTIKSGTLTFEAMLNAPEFLNTNDEMLNACSNRLVNYWAALASPDGYTNGVHWSELADTDSMATYFLTLELFGNDDAEKKSRYLYWDVGGKIMFGPVWDFDWGLGNTVVDANINKPETWRVNNANERSFLREWTDDPWFCTRLRTLYWAKVRDVFARMIGEGGELDQYHAYLAEAAAANDALWPVKDLATNQNLSFEDDVAKLRTFLTTRLAWLDQQFADVPTLMASLKAACSTRQSNSPYTADAATLPIVLANVSKKGALTMDPELKVTLDGVGESVATIDVYANGLKVGESVPDENGKVAFTVPARMLTEKIGDDNCISLVARDANGAVVARNYALVKQSPPLLIFVK